MLNGLDIENDEDEYSAFLCYDVAFCVCLRFAQVHLKACAFAWLFVAVLAVLPRGAASVQLGMFIQR